jgi:predicted AAA+ superfamily ATPase
MIRRQLTATFLKRIGQSPAVALLGSRQVGKTTLAKALDFRKPTRYLDLERPSDLAKLADPELYLSGFANQLVILDEVQRLPKLLDTHKLWTSLFCAIP